MGVFPNADSANRIFYGVTDCMNENWRGSHLKEIPAASLTCPVSSNRMLLGRNYLSLTPEPVYSLHSSMRSCRYWNPGVMLSVIPVASKVRTGFPMFRRPPVLKRFSMTEKRKVAGMPMAIS